MPVKYCTGSLTFSLEHPLTSEACLGQQYVGVSIIKTKAEPD